MPNFTSHFGYMKVRQRKLVRETPPTGCDDSKRGSESIKRLQEADGKH